MKYKRNILLLFQFCIILLVGQSCFSDNRNNNSTHVDRFETDINNYGHLSSSEKKDFKNKYADIISIFYAEPNNTDSLLLSIPNSIIYKTFAQDVSNRFANLDTLSSLLNDINHNMEKSFKVFITPRITTYITQYNQSIVTTDSAVLIALNQYLGANHPMYEYYESYQRLKKIPSQIPYDYAEALIRTNVENLHNNKETLLDRIIYEGLIAHIITKVVPNSNANFLGYTPAQVEWCKTNEINIWKSIVSQDILYSKSRIIANQLLSPAPFTALISQDCPGEIGRWIGYQIITSYIKNNNTKGIEQLATTIINTDSQTILMNAKYNGQQ